MKSIAKIIAVMWIFTMVRQQTLHIWHDIAPFQSPQQLFQVAAKCT